MRRVQREMRLDDVSPCRNCFDHQSYVWERVPVSAGSGSGGDVVGP